MISVIQAASAVKQAGAVVESYAWNHRGEHVLRVPASGEVQLTVHDEVGQWIGNYGATVSRFSRPSG